MFGKKNGDNKMPPKVKILHLEDDIEWCEIVQAVLKGYDVYNAHTLEEALNLYKGMDFDIAILDISLIPSDSQDELGEHLLKALVSLHILPSKRIIILSAYLAGSENMGLTRRHFKFYNVFAAIPKQKFDSKEFREAVDDAARISNVFEKDE
jgi:CheY-like chemotaxis protein